MKEITESNFDAHTTNGVVVVEFGAEWCAPCKKLLPLLDRAATDYAGKASFYSVDIDKDQNLAARNGVMSVPVVIFFKGGKAVDRLIANVQDRELRKRLDALVGAG